MIRLLLYTVPHIMDTLLLLISTKKENVKSYINVVIMSVYRKSICEIISIEKNHRGQKTVLQVAYSCLNMPPTSIKRDKNSVNCKTYRGWLNHFQAFSFNWSTSRVSL